MPTFCFIKSGKPRIKTLCDGDHGTNKKKVETGEKAAEKVNKAAVVPPPARVVQPAPHAAPQQYMPLHNMPLHNMPLHNMRNWGKGRAASLDQEGGKKKNESSGGAERTNDSTTSSPRKKNRAPLREEEEEKSSSELAQQSSGPPPVPVFANPYTPGGVPGPPGMVSANQPGFGIPIMSMVPFQAYPLGMPNISWREPEPPVEPRGVTVCVRQKRGELKHFVM